MLQPAQQLGDVVARLGVERDGADVHLAELQLGVDHLAHGIANDEVQWILFGSAGNQPQEPAWASARLPRINGLEIQLPPYRSGQRANFDLGVRV